MPLLDEAARLDMLLKQFSGTDYAPPSSYQIAAVINVPDEEDGTGLGEPDDFNYERITVSNDSTEFGLASSGSEIVNLNSWAFPQAQQDWGTVFGLALFTGSGDYMGYLPFATPKFVNAENILRISAGSFLVTSDTTPLSVTIEEAAVPIILTSPQGDRYDLRVTNSGTLELTGTPFFGVPSAPTALQNNSGILQWTPSPADGGTPVVSQTVWVSDAESGLVEFDVIDAEATTYSLEGATGAVYVTADNVVGPSAPSNTVYVT